MYRTPCDFIPTTAGLSLFQAELEIPEATQGELRVTFRPLKYYPPERGAGADFDAKIIKIEIRDIQDERKRGGGWHKLLGRDEDAAKAFLERHFHADMWERAFEETAEYFGAVTYYRAAA